MLFSLALIFLCGMGLGSLFQKLKLPALLGMLLTGILLGPSVLNLLDGSILAVSADLRRIALIIILTRAGLNLDLADLKKVGRPAVLGAVIAAVSPAVVVPKMLKLMDEGYGTRQSIPQMILAGASVDDVFVIVLFTSFTGLAAGEGVAALDFAKIPTSIVLGVAGGVACGWVLAELFRRVHMRDSAKVVLLLSTSFLLVTLEDALPGPVGFSGLLAVMAMGIALQYRRGQVAARLSQKYAKLWVAAELLLFVLVGAAVDVGAAAETGLAAVGLIFGALCFRMVGVLVCTLGTRLTGRERLFCMLAYTPKATVQAAIGSVPLAMGLACGQTVLAVAVLAILITAPLGSVAIESTYRRLLQKE